LRQFALNAERWPTAVGSAPQATCRAVRAGFAPIVHRAASVGAIEDYFADGMSDALTTELGNLSSLRVISRQSVLRLKGTTKLNPFLSHARQQVADAIVA
jgi:hypothetical protein